MKIISAMKVRRLQKSKHVLWHEGVDYVPKDAKRGFAEGRVCYWPEGKSYVIRDRFFPWFQVYWCITKKFYDEQTA